MPTAKRSPRPTARPTAKRIAGKVTSVNISPKGHIEGVLVATADGVVQLNLPKHAAPAGSRFAVGARVDTPAEPDGDEDSEHPVYEVSEVVGARDGAVTRFNYARHGEVNGYHLDDGAFVHVKPDGAARYKVKVGDRIRVEGRAVRGDDAVVIEATRVVKITGK